MNLKMFSYSKGQVWDEILVATMEGYENGTTLWWKPKGMLEVTIIGLGQDGENWDDNCWVLWILPWGGVGKTYGVVAILSLLISFIVWKLIFWLKGTSTKVSWFRSKEGGLVVLSFNFPFPLEVFFCLPPLTCVHAELIKISMKNGLMFFLKVISRVGCYLSNIQGQPH